ncbi:MAG TPA: CBS domain-containing protein [Candidatus Binatia bacterium]|nr:CBS domain-containing protein [Candidatus Binatia bacterium]
MTNFIFAVVLALAMLYCVSLAHTYKRASVKEVRRQARSGSESAKRLYKPLVYGSSLQIFLWLIIVISAAGSFMLFASLTSKAVSLVLIAAILAMAFWWLPLSRDSKFRLWLANSASPLLDKIMHYLYPLIKPIDKLMSKHYPLHVHSGLYEKSDLIELLTWQSKQPDNRILPEELTAALAALRFADKSVGSVMTPKAKVFEVAASDTVGPLLMDDLHKSGYTSFPVYEGKKSHLVGVLYLSDLIKVKSGGLVSSHMRTNVYYLHEDYSLYQALQVLTRSREQLYLVVDGVADFIGIVTARVILEQVVGELPVADLESYTNPQVVASSLSLPEIEESSAVDDSLPPEVL